MLFLESSLITLTPRTAAVRARACVRVRCRPIVAQLHNRFQFPSPACLLAAPRPPPLSAACRTDRGRSEATSSVFLRPGRAGGPEQRHGGRPGLRELRQSAAGGEHRVCASLFARIHRVASRCSQTLTLQAGPPPPLRPPLSLSLPSPPSSLSSSSSPETQSASPCALNMRDYGTFARAVESHRVRCAPRPRRLTAVTPSPQLLRRIGAARGSDANI